MKSDNSYRVDNPRLALTEPLCELVLHLVKVVLDLGALPHQEGGAAVSGHQGEQVLVWVVRHQVGWLHIQQVHVRTQAARSMIDE